MPLTPEQQKAMNKDARSLVLEALGDSKALANVDFDIGGFTVNPNKLARVRDHVLASEIKVRFDSEMWDRAVYDADSDVIYLGRFSYPDPAAVKALIIHECTHAMMDRYKTWINEAMSEVIGYVAQMLYYLGRKPGATAPYVQDEKDREVLRSAFRFARYLTDRRKGLGATDWASMKNAWEAVPQLMAAIMAHELYRDQLAKADAERDGIAGYNGVAGWSYTDPDA